MNDVRQFVLVEYFGGPRDGQREAAPWPLVTEEIRISLPTRNGMPLRDDVPARIESRIGFYRFRGSYRVFHVTEIQLQTSNVPLIRMLEISLGEDVTAFDWKGEE